MSRRFGRQQKRKLKQALADLEHKNTDLKNQLSLLREFSKRNREIVEDTARLLGEHFITLEPTDIEIRDLKALPNEWAVQQYELSRCGSAFAQSSATEFMELALAKIQYLPVMKCDALLSELQSAVHFRFTFRGKTAGYAISQSAIMQTPHFKEVSRKHVADAVMRLFMDTEPRRAQP